MMRNHAVLDNLIWEMLCYDLHNHSKGTTLAKRCDPEIVGFFAVADYTPQSIKDLWDLGQKEERIILMSATSLIPEAIEGFDIKHRFSFDQLVCQKHISVPEITDVEVIKLTTEDVDDIKQLIELTKPGPFFPGLLDKRNFRGIRKNGQLVAMAGERIKLPGYCEISAVCTHPDWRGKGYAKLLSLVIADGIWKRGSTPFLHVLPNNVNAYRIYESIHFVKRTEMTGIVLAPKEQ